MGERGVNISKESNMLTMTVRLPLNEADVLIKMAKQLPEDLWGGILKQAAGLAKDIIGK